MGLFDSVSNVVSTASNAVSTAASQVYNQSTTAAQQLSSAGVNSKNLAQVLPVAAVAFGASREHLATDSVWAQTVYPAVKPWLASVPGAGQAMAALEGYVQQNYAQPQDGGSSSSGGYYLPNQAGTASGPSWILPIAIGGGLLVVGLLIFAVARK